MLTKSEAPVKLFPSKTDFANRPIFTFPNVINIIIYLKMPWESFGSLTKYHTLLSSISYRLLKNPRLHGRTTKSSRKLSTAHSSLLSLNFKISTLLLRVQSFLYSLFLASCKPKNNSAFSLGSEGCIPSSAIPPCDRCLPRKINPVPPPPPACCRAPFSTPYHLLEW